MIDVVVTGLGAVTPLGQSVDESWENLLEGRSGVRPITRFDASRLRTRVAGQVPDLEPPPWIDRRLAARVDRFIQLAVTAGMMAAHDARLVSRDGFLRRTAVLMGNTFAGASQLEQGFINVVEGDGTRLSPYFVPGSIGNMAASVTALALGAHGPTLTVNQACASGAAAIGLGLRLLRAGDADTVIAGGCEAALTRLIYSAYHTLKATTSRNHEPERASRPFDRDRDGFVPAEGAAAIVLESREAAERRGAVPLAELAGYGTSCDANHVTQPDPSAESCAECMRLALEDAGLEPRDIDAINAHGTSTRLNDVVEARAIAQVFAGDAARIPVTANKSLIGHTIGAAGAIEGVFSILSLRDQVVPPTANYESPDPECGPLDVPTKARATRLAAVLSNSFGFGGANSSLVFRAA